jgi:hypothetical protein
MTNDQTSAISGARWRKSSYSGGGNNCVEVAEVSAARAVRDSKNPDGENLIFRADVWEAFIADIKNGGYDRL